MSAYTSLSLCGLEVFFWFSGRVSDVLKQHGAPFTGSEPLPSQTELHSVRECAGSHGLYQRFLSDPKQRFSCSLVSVFFFLLKIATLVSAEIEFTTTISDVNLLPQSNN